MSHQIGSVLSERKASLGSLILPQNVSAAALAVDVLAIVLAGFGSRALYSAATDIAVEPGLWLGMSLMLALFFTLLMRARGLYEAQNLLVTERQVKAAVLAWSASFGLVLGFAFLFKASADLSRGAALLLAGMGLFLVVCHRLAWRFGLARALARGAIRRRKAVVLSTAPWESSSAQMRSLRHGGIEIAHRVFLPVDGAERREALSRVVASTREFAAQEVVLVVSADQLGQLDAVLEELRAVPLPIRLLPDARLSQLLLQPSRRVGSFALVDITREPLSARERWIKRALDIAVAGLALAATAPLLILAMAAIKLDSAGPVLFRQTRKGFNGRDFKILKLRTMSVLEDGEGIVQATKRDPRVTRIGSWLRRTSIDELPQLWNVLRGEMSVVGPRPHAVAHDNYYDTLIENYAFRHHVKPGLTGWAQVRGHRGETPHVSMMAARVEHDIWYINNWSLLLDLRILFLTATRILDRTAY